MMWWAVLLVVIMVHCAGVHTGGWSAVSPVIFEPLKVNSERCPYRLKSRVVLVGNVQVTLDLELSSHVRPHAVPMSYHDNNNNLTTWTPQREHYTGCFYQDLSSLAAFSTKYVPGQPVKLKGTFHHAGRMYGVKPMSTAVQRLKRAAGLRRRRHAHVVYDMGPSLDPSLLPSSMSSRTRRSATSYQVELLAVIDYEEYIRWYNFPDGSPTSQSVALENIRYFYSHVINEIDLRYRCIVSSQFQLSVILSGFYVATERTFSTWTESSSNKYNDNVVADRALTTLKTWLNQQSQQLPTADHAMLFTGHDIVDAADLSSTLITGQAYVGDVCRYGRVSIIENQGLFSTASIGAHELGHNLGANHDGTDNTECPSADQYLMTPLMEERSVDTFDNIYTFSSCSVQDFANLISELNRGSDNCLSNTGSVFDSSSWSSYMSNEPGKKYSLDEQCYFIYGASSYFCGQQSDLPNLCKNLFCWDTGREACFQVSSPGALDYTSCGNRKWCYHGSCISNSEAPEADESCFFGDYRGELWNGTMDCAVMAATKPWYCYNQVNRDICCQSCANILTGIQDCEYGDQASWCSNLQSHQCYNNEVACCHTCQQYKTDIDGCAYGNRVTWCTDDVFKAVDCYNNDQWCCETCSRHSTGNADCVFGDRVRWCTKSHCMNQGNHHSCCATCDVEVDNNSSTGGNNSNNNSGNNNNDNNDSNNDSNDSNNNSNNDTSGSNNLKLDTFNVLLFVVHAVSI